MAIGNNALPAKRAGAALVLIVDDYDDSREMYAEFLELSGFRVCQAHDGGQGLVKARQLHPDVIVMDISMPHMNGLEATKQIRKEIPQSRVLVLSQHDSSHIVTAAIEAGAAGYVTKSQVAHYLLVALEAVAAGQSFPWTDAEAVPLNGKRAGVKE